MKPRSQMMIGAIALLVGIVPIGAAAMAPASGSESLPVPMDLAGDVFVDVDRDGRVDVDEQSGVPEMTVEISVRGDATVAPVSPDGTFSASINAVPGDLARVVFDVPDGYQATFLQQLGDAPVAAGPIVQYLTVSSRPAPITFGIVPDSQCPVNATGQGAPSTRSPDGNPNSTAGKVWTSCYVDGARDSPVGAQDVLVGANFDASGWLPAAEANNFGGNIDVEHIGTKSALGAVWGVAYDEWDGVLYASAVVKRHADLGPEGIDGLYWFSVGAAGTATDPSSISLDSLSPPEAPSYGGDPLACPPAFGGASYDYESFRPGQSARGGAWDCRDIALAGAPGQSYDWWAFDRTGRSGIGDIDVTPDGHQLLVMNASADVVFVYDITSGSPVYVSHHPVDDPGCADGEFEAWALTARDAQNAYVGVTCTASTSTQTSDLAGHVVRLDIASGAQAAIATVPFEYARGAGWTDQSGPLGGAFQPWLAAPEGSTPELPDVTVAAAVVFSADAGAWVYANGWDYHQPLLSDIEIDPIDESLVLGVTDRWAMMTGVFSCDLDPSSAGCAFPFPAPPVGDYDDQLGDDEVAAYDSGIIGYTAGDLLRLCNTGTISVPRFELEGAEDCDPSEFSPAFDPRFGGGPAGEVEWYWNDQAFATEQTENAHPEGAQGALFIGDRRTDVVYTAMNPIDTFGAGLSWDANSDGAHRNGFQFFRSDLQNRDGTGFKSAALGDVEGCTIPIEAVVHTWFDANANGTRDELEPPISGLGVELLTASGALVLATVSDADGRVEFGTGDGLLPSTSYELRFAASDLTDTDGFGVGRSELRATLTDQGDDRFDSDVVDDRLAFTTGAPGQNDQTLAAGFGRADDFPEGTSITVGDAPTLGDDGELLGAPDGSSNPLRTVSIVFGMLGVLIVVMIFALRWSWTRE